MNGYLNINIVGTVDVATGSAEAKLMRDAMKRIQEIIVSLSNLKSLEIESNIRVLQGTLAQEEDEAASPTEDELKMAEVLNAQFERMDAKVKAEGKCDCKWCTHGWKLRQAYMDGLLTVEEAYKAFLSMAKQAQESDGNTGEQIAKALAIALDESTDAPRVMMAPRLKHMN